MLENILEGKIEYINDEVIISGKARFSDEKYSVTVKYEDIVSWLNGELIQKVMPYLSREQREFLISGNIPSDWKEIFK